MRAAAGAAIAERDRDFALAEAAMAGAPGDDTAALEIAADELPIEFADPVAGVDDGEDVDAEERAEARSPSRPARRATCRRPGRPANATRSTEPP